MKPLQKMIGANNLENALFPLTSLYVTNNESGHNGRYIVDIVEWNGSGQVTNAPLYAPVSCKCVYVGSDSTLTPTVAWESLKEVNFADGTIDYMTISVSHDNNFSKYKVGETRRQGEVFANTGNEGIGTGDHCHLIIGKGKYVGYETKDTGYTLKNEYHSYLSLGVNDTTIYNTGGYTWLYFDTSKKKDLFLILSLVNALKWGV